VVTVFDGGDIATAGSRTGSRAGARVGSAAGTGDGGGDAGGAHAPSTNIAARETE
jgi:hypothetical protein